MPEEARHYDRDCDGVCVRKYSLRVDQMVFRAKTRCICRKCKRPDSGIIMEADLRNRCRD